MEGNLKDIESSTWTRRAYHLWKDEKTGELTGMTDEELAASIAKPPSQIYWDGRRQKGWMGGKDIWLLLKNGGAVFKVFKGTYWTRKCKLFQPAVEGLLNAIT